MVYHPARQRCPIGARLGASPVVAGLTGLSASRSPSGWRNRWRRRDRSSATTPRAVLSGVDHTAPPVKMSDSGRVRDELPTMLRKRSSTTASACGCTSLGSTRWWCRATGPPRCARCPSGTRAITRCGLARGGL